VGRVESAGKRGSSKRSEERRREEKSEEGRGKSGGVGKTSDRVAA